MKILIIISLLFFLTGNKAFCQTIKFKGQLLQGVTIIKNYTLNVDGKPATTDDAGIFYAPVSAAAKQIIIQTSDQKYVIVYPQGGRALIPKDPTLITQIVVAAFKSNDYLKSYLTVSKQIQDSIGKSQVQTKSLKTQLDSIVKILHKLSYTDSDLRTAREIAEGKDRNIFDITSDLAEYAGNATDLLSAFKYISDFAFSNSKAIFQLTDAINNYNKSYERLDGKKIFYQKTIADYWSNAQADSFQHLVSFAMDTVHEQRIYPLRDLLKQINEYFNSNKKSDEIKKDIQKKIADVITDNTNLIARLRKMIAEFSQSLIT